MPSLVTKPLVMGEERDLQGKGPSSILGGGFHFSLEILPIIVKTISVLKFSKSFKKGSDCLLKGNLRRRHGLHKK